MISDWGETSRRKREETKRTIQLCGWHYQNHARTPAPSKRNKRGIITVGGVIMADFSNAKGQILVLPSGLTCVPFHYAGSGFHVIVVAHTVLGADEGFNYIGRVIWASEADIISAEVIPSHSLIGLAAAYGPTHLGKDPNGIQSLDDA